MINQAHDNSILPLNPEQIARLKLVIQDYSPAQLAWLSGYFWGIVNQLSKTDNNIEPSTITLISASQSGNARRLAEQLRDDLLSQNLKVNLVNARDYKFKKINQEKLIVIITSTQGAGEPPEEALGLYKFLMSKKSPKMKDSAFAVFGLGDKSYEFFSQAGKNFDKRLEELGAKRLLERVDADINYQTQAKEWRKQIVEILKSRVSYLQDTLQSIKIKQNNNNFLYTKDAPLNAKVITNQKITGRYSDKDVRHIEIDVSNAFLRYHPGDSLGVWYENDPSLIDELLDLLSLTGKEKVSVNHQTLILAEALKKYYELTVNTPQIVTKYSQLSSNKVLNKKCNDTIQLQQYAQKMPIVDMVRFAPKKLTAECLISLLRPLTPRFYSIASSQSEYENEIHITVGAVRYKIDGHARAGGASSYLIDRIKEDNEIRIFIDKNDNFRLPKNPKSSVIMIGAGTGIAPFRAFMQQRDYESATGKNWLFFGNPHFTEDFLYQVEWQHYVKDGLLTRIDLAWSQDQQHKIYVQDKIRDQGAEVWQWIVNGAYIYLCGNASHMAKDVEKTLLEVISRFGGMDMEAADEFLTNLRIERRYQRDVY